MTLKNGILELAAKVPDVREALVSEEATKQALIVPFIKALGYDVYDPREVFPEYTADFGTKQGEKVDYAIMKDGVPVILIECKRVTDNLNAPNAVSQLFRYFVSTGGVRLGILTNGVKYQFFSDLDEQNVMDSTPFLELDLENLTDTGLEHLARFVKGFDVKTTVEEAARIRHIDRIKGLLERQLSEPDKGFVDWIRRELYPDKTSGAFRAMLPEMVKQAAQDFVKDKIRETPPPAQNSPPPDKGRGDETAPDTPEVPAYIAIPRSKGLYYQGHEKQYLGKDRKLCEALIPDHARIYRLTEELCNSDKKKPEIVAWWAKFNDGDTVGDALSRPGYHRSWLGHRIKEWRIYLDSDDIPGQASSDEDTQKLQLLSAYVPRDNRRDGQTSLNTRNS